MTDETLTEATTLKAKIASARETLGRLNDPGFYVELHQTNKSDRAHALIATIGVGENCEHWLAPLATEFHAAVVAQYTAKMEEFERQFTAL